MIVIPKNLLKYTIVLFSILPVVRSSIRLLEASRATSETKKPSIPRILWVNVHKVPGRNSEKDELFDENISSTIQKYKEAWNNDDSIEVNTLSTHTCKEAISKVPIKGASTDLLKYFLEENDPYRDICHIAVLFLHGGYFVQKSVEIIEPYIVPNDISFAAVTISDSSKFHESFLASAPYNTLLYRALKKYILLAQGQLKLETTSAFGEIMHSSYMEVTSVNPNKKSIMTLLSVQDLNELHEQHDEYKKIKKQDAEGEYCNQVVVDLEKKKTYFYIVVPGASEALCSKVTDAGKVNLHILTTKGSESVPNVVSKSLKPDPIIEPKESSIPHILWLNIHHVPGRDSERDRMFDDNILKIISKYKNAWNDKFFDVRQLTTENCKDAIMRIPLSGASTHLLNHHLEKDPQRHICHIAVLHLYGGYYIQRSVDVIDPFIPESDDISLVAVTNPESEMFHGSFLAAAPNHRLLYKTLDKYILAARGQLKFETPSAVGELMRSSYREIALEDPNSKSSMLLLSAKHLHKLQHEHKEYQAIRSQDGEGPYCNYAIVDDIKKKLYFYTIFPGSSEPLCRKVMPKIPHKIWFASRHGLTKSHVEVPATKEKHYDNIRNTVEAYQSAWDTDAVDYEVLDKNACMDAIFKSPTLKASPAVIDYYKNSDHENFDLCRAVILQEQGGYFINEEVEVIEPYIVKKNDITFVGVENLSGLLLSSFVAAVPHHPIMYDVMIKYVMLAERKLSIFTSNTSGEIFRDSYNAQKDDIKSNSILLKEKDLTLMSGEFNVKPKEKEARICNFIISDPDSDTIHFFTRIFQNGAYCFDKEP